MTSTPRLGWLSRLGELASTFVASGRLAEYAALLEPLWSSHGVPARVEQLWNETRDCRTFVLRPGPGFGEYQAGQHVPVSLPVGGRWETRVYSITSSPARDDGRISITVKLQPDGVVSRHLVRRVRVGDYVWLGPAEGEGLACAASEPVLWVTAGIGVAPIMSMLRTGALCGALPDTVHLHYAPHAGQVIFNAELMHLARVLPQYRLHRVLTDTAGPAAAKHRHFSAEQLVVCCSDWRKRKVFVCGPRPLADAVFAHYAHEGLSRQVHVLRFASSRRFSLLTPPKAVPAAL